MSKKVNSYIKSMSAEELFKALENSSDNVMEEILEYIDEDSFDNSEFPDVRIEPIDLTRYEGLAMSEMRKQVLEKEKVVEAMCPERIAIGDQINFNDRERLMVRLAFLDEIINCPICRDNYLKRIRKNTH